MLRVWNLSGIFLDYSFPDQSSYFYIAWVPLHRLTPVNTGFWSLIERPKKQEGLLTNVYHNRAIQIHTHTHIYIYIYIYIIYIHDKVLYLVRHGSKWPQERSRLKSIRLLSIYEEQKTPLCPNEEVCMDDTWLLDIKFFWQILPSF